MSEFAILSQKQPCGKLNEDPRSERYLEGAKARILAFSGPIASLYSF